MILTIGELGVDNMKFENTEVFNFEGAIRGMRNPKESWVKSDSGYCGTQSFNGSP